MDTVSRQFCERVTALWNCCQLPHTCSCVAPRFGEVWAETFVTKKAREFVDLVIGYADGEWTYELNRCLISPTSETMDELMKYLDLQNVRIGVLKIVNEAAKTKVDCMEKLLNFASCITNEPDLQLWFEISQSTDPQGIKLLEWLEGRTFTSIDLKKMSSVYVPLLRNHSARRIYPEIVETIRDADCGIVLEDLLTSRQLRRFKSIEERHPLPSQVMKRMVENYMADPSKYAEDKLNIEAKFDDSTFAMLEGMAKKHICKLGPYFVFDGQQPLLAVGRRSAVFGTFVPYPKEDVYRIKTMEKFNFMCLFEDSFEWMLRYAAIWPRW